MTGRLAADATVTLEDPVEAGTVYARGYFGTVGGGRLLLDRLESTYLVEMQRLEVSGPAGRPVEFAEMLRRAARVEPGFGIRYLVYRDLRQRGYVVRSSPPPATFAVLPRGGVLHKTPARFWVEPLSERRPFALAQVLALAERAKAARKQLLLAVVDEESDLTYYLTRLPSPNGTQPMAPSQPTFEALVNEDRVLVLDPTAVERLGGSLSFGSRVGHRLELSVLEASYLARRGTLELRELRTARGVSAERLEQRAARLDPHYPERRSVYGWLRDHGLIVKTGFKYGSHFRAYPRDPEHAHARYLIQAVRPDYSAPWPVVSGAVRLAQGVRKEHLFAVDGTSSDVRFLSLERIRP
ncbi:MAG: tRNA-intron lyase [Thermoplasmata archaeon]|nr:tRNA-intron lyase [Thermoplasmata archaeon]MCI4340958.1 tRNA-intron lyase [Thermoplasmata archaeon]